MMGEAFPLLFFLLYLSQVMKLMAIGVFPFTVQLIYKKILDTDNMLNLQINWGARMDLIRLYIYRMYIHVCILNLMRV